MTPFFHFGRIEHDLFGVFFSSSNCKAIFWGTKTTNFYKNRSFWPQIQFFPRSFWVQFSAASGTPPSVFRPSTPPPPPPRGLALRDSDDWGPVNYERDRYVVVTLVWYSAWGHVLYLAIYRCGYGNREVPCYLGFPRPIAPKNPGSNNYLMCVIFTVWLCPCPSREWKTCCSTFLAKSFVS